MDIELGFPTGSELPNLALTERFDQIEFITMVREEPDGLVCYAKLTFKTPEDLVESNESFKIISIKSQNENSAIAIIKIKGPISMMFHDDDEVWWVSPTVLHSTGLTLTIQGTRGASKELVTNYLFGWERGSALNWAPTQPKGVSFKSCFLKSKKWCYPWRLKWDIIVVRGVVPNAILQRSWTSSKQLLASTFKAPSQK